MLKNFMRKISLPVLLLLFYSYTSAQVDLSNTGILHISHGSDTLYINGAFSNSSSAAFVNNGNFYLKQNLSNSQASMSIGTGTFYMNGSALQSVEGSETFKTFNLVSNNTSGIVLNNNLSISGTHTFSNGVISTSATPNYLIYEAGSSYIGDDDNRHVNGWIKKFGNTNFTFPVGNGTVERSIAINDLSSMSEFNVKHNLITPDINQVQVPLIAVDSFEYWNITKISGGSSSVTMTWNNSKLPFPNWETINIRAAGYDGSKWIDEGGIATGNSSAGSITSNNIFSFSKFTLGLRAIPLPLTLISFSAKYSGSYTLLNWKTVNEQNVDHFVVERSDDGIHFYPVSQIAARNSGNTEIYSIIDNRAINHIAYYRLRIVDTDGHERLSSIVTVTDNNVNNLLTLLANPVRDGIILIASRQLNGTFNYNIAAMNGQLLQQGILVIQNGGRYQLQLNRNFKPGTYTLQISNKLESFGYKLIVK
jgi:hypothetical protein